MNRLKASFLLFILLILLPGSILCQEPVSRLVESEATAPILNNDEKLAREVAIFEAKRTAVEPLGVKIDSDTLFSMGLQVADWFRIKVGGYVRDYEVLAEKKTGNGYWVKIKAWVKNGDEEKKATQGLLSAGKVMVTTQGEGSREIEGLLTEKMNESGFRYHDAEFVRKNVRPATWENLVHRRILNLDRDAFRFMADLVVHVQSAIRPASLSNELGGTWFIGEGRIRLFQISEEHQGEAVIDTPARSTKLFGRGTGEAALRDVIGTGHPNGFSKQIGYPVVASFMTSLTQSDKLKVGDRTISVRITGIPSDAEFEEFLTTLRHQRGVQGRATVLSQDKGVYTVGVTLPMKTTYLAYLLSAYPKYRLTAHDWSRIELVYRNR